VSPNIHLSVDYLLSKAEEKYWELVLSSKWDISASGATFNLTRNNDTGRGRQGNHSPITTGAFARPTEGESEIKTILGHEHKYCGKCRQWNKESRAHTNSEHVVGFKTNDDRSATSEAGSDKLEKPVASKTRQPNAQSYHFRRFTFIGGI
jgi:hypothetical protein